MSFVPLKRTLHLANPEMHGSDVASLQQLLNEHGADLTVDGVYGIHTAEEVQNAKHRLKMSPADLLAGPQFETKLQGEHVPPKPPDPWAQVRASIAADAMWMIAHHAPYGIGYGELRPRQGRTRRAIPFTTDCSGSETDLYEWQVQLFRNLLIPNPNGGPFDARAYTGLMLQHCAPIIARQAKVADLIVFGNYPGVHTSLLLDAGTVPNPRLFNHGRQGQPIETTLADEISVHGAGAIHWLTAFKPLTTHLLEENA